MKRRVFDMKIISGNREFKPSAAEILAMATNRNNIDLDKLRQTVTRLEREKELWRNLEFSHFLIPLE